MINDQPQSCSSFQYQVKFREKVSSIPGSTFTMAHLLILATLLLTTGLSHGFSQTLYCANCGFSRGSQRDHHSDSIPMNRKFPWLVRIRFEDPKGFGATQCLGSFISNKHIVTAARCFYDWKFKYEPHLAKVHISMIDDKNPLDVDSLRDNFYHENEDDPTPEREDSSISDLGIVVLKEAVTFSPSIQPICLPNLDVENNTVLKTVKIRSKATRRSLTFKGSNEGQESIDLPDEKLGNVTREEQRVRSSMTVQEYVTRSGGPQPSVCSPGFESIKVASGTVCRKATDVIHEREDAFLEISCVRPISCYEPCGNNRPEIIEDEPERSRDPAGSAHRSHVYGCSAGSCPGEMGSPLMYFCAKQGRYYLIGVTSRSCNQGADMPNLYTSIFNSKSFIDDHADSSGCHLGIDADLVVSPEDDSEGQGIQCI